MSKQKPALLSWKNRRRTNQNFRSVRPKLFDGKIFSNRSRRLRKTASIDSDFLETGAAPHRRHDAPLHLLELCPQRTRADIAGNSPGRNRGDFRLFSQKISERLGCINKRCVAASILEPLSVIFGHFPTSSVLGSYFLSNHFAVFQGLTSIPLLLPFVKPRQNSSEEYLYQSGHSLPSIDFVILVRSVPSVFRV
jgi:hypothetical protein